MEPLEVPLGDVLELETPFYGFRMNTDSTVRASVTTENQSRHSDEIDSSEYQTGKAAINKKKKQ